MFLLYRADAGGLGQADLAAAGDELAEDDAEERGLARAVAADQPDLVAGANRERHAPDDEGAGHFDRESPSG